MEVDSYKLLNPIEFVCLQIFDDELRNVNYDKPERSSFKDIEGELNKYLKTANDSFQRRQKDSYRDSIFNITSLLQRREIPQNYEPFKKLNFFNNLLSAFSQWGHIQNTCERPLDEVEKGIIKESVKLIYVLSSHRDCCDYLNSIDFFGCITNFLSDNGRSKFRHCPKIYPEYSHLLIRALSNFSIHKDYHAKINSVMISYAVNIIYNSNEPKYYIDPLRFFSIYFNDYFKDFFKEAYSRGVFNDKIVEDIVSAIGDFPLSYKLPILKKKEGNELLIRTIHQLSAQIILFLTKMSYLPIDKFFESDIDKFLKNHFLEDKNLMITIGFIAKNYPGRFADLGISLADICNGFNSKDQDFLQYTFITVFYVLSSPQNEELMSSDLIFKIIDFSVAIFECSGYLTKLYALAPLFFIYSKMKSIYTKKISVVFFLLENCPMFVSDNNEINNVITAFLCTFYGFLDKSRNIDRFGELADEFNKALEAVQNSEENFDKTAISALKFFEES